MNQALVFAVICAFAAVVHANDNSGDVFYEEIPEHQPDWKFRPGPAMQDSDSQGDEWHSKFIMGSDKRLGTARDAAAIKASVPSTMPVTIRWVSRSVVVVAADCYCDARFSHRMRCLYVLEKHGSKWTLTHHYSHHLRAIVRSNQTLERTADRCEDYFR